MMTRTRPKRKNKSLPGVSEVWEEKGTNRMVVVQEFLNGHVLFQNLRTQRPGALALSRFIKDFTRTNIREFYSARRVLMVLKGA